MAASAVLQESLGVPLLTHIQGDESPKVSPNFAAFVEVSPNFAAFVESSCLLAYHIRQYCRKTENAPRQLIQLWFATAIEIERNRMLKAAATDRWNDYLSFRPVEIDGASREVFLRDLLNVHVQLRNIRRELYREETLGPRNRESLLNLSNIVRICIQDFHAARLNTGCAGLDTPLRALRLLRRRLSGITTKRWSQILNTNAYENTVLRPFSQVLARYHTVAHEMTAAVPWKDELNKASGTVLDYQVESSPTADTILKEAIAIPTFEIDRFSEADRQVLKAMTLSFLARAGTASERDIRLWTPLKSKSVQLSLEMLLQDGLICEAHGSFRITAAGIKAARRRSLLFSLFEW